MQAIERFFTNTFGSIFNRIRYSATNMAERKIRETLENRYEQAMAPKDKKEGDRNV